MKERLAVLDSGNGDKLQSLLDACASGQRDGRVLVVVSDQREAGALDVAEAAGITALFHPFDWFLETGRGTTEYETALLELIAPYEPDRIMLADWPHTPGEIMLEHYRGRIRNIKT